LQSCLLRSQGGLELKILVKCFFFYVHHKRILGSTIR
jgi:hypothetical protein